MRGSEGAELNVLREVHPIPKVDETLAQLSGATLFSKLDANSGFWHCSDLLLGMATLLALNSE